ncbi:MAG TPA: TonB family protein [Methylocella sp.]|nr:TonB family protein [Methylocella sp.]
MSTIAEPGAAAERGAAPQNLARPVWLRLLVMTLVISAHIMVLVGFGWFLAEKITPLDEIHVELVPQGETVTETSTVPTPESAPVISADPAVLASPDPQMNDDPNVSKPVEQMAQAEPVPDLALPPPKIESPDAPPLPIERPKPRKIEKSKTLADQPSERLKKAYIAEALRRAALRALKRAKAEMHARRLAAQAQMGAPAIRAGVKEGTGEARRMSNAAYAALVSAEINRHKHYPASAREAGATGSVGVVFSVGASGAIVSHSITRSSGNSAIDATVHEMMASSHPPPPPGGHFRGSVTISFNMAR